MSRTVIINSDKSIGYLDDHKGHTFVGVREWDPGTAVKQTGAYVLEFSDKPAPQERITADELNTLMECAVRAAAGQGIEAYREFHMQLLERIFTNTYKHGSAEKKVPEYPQCLAEIGN